MSVRMLANFYGVCDRCGAEDDDGRPTEEEARDRMWPGDLGMDLCWDCAESQEPSGQDGATDGR